MIPDSLRLQLSEKFSIHIQQAVPVSGGDINKAFKCSTNEGDFFLKYNLTAPEDFFEKEAAGLQKLKNADTGLHIPEVVAVGKNESEIPGFLLMEYIQTGRSGDSFLFGQELARLHLNHHDYYGLDTDNYIGSLHQKNDYDKNWVSFFTEKRITPQLDIAFNSGKLPLNIHKNWERLVAVLPTLFPPSHPSLLHGDLWSGNYLFDNTGKTVLIDPAVYYGHPEMDLAFTKMFGGFSSDFYSGYESITPLETGFSERIQIYNLYPLLVHVNLFGGHYSTQFEQIIKSY